MISDESPNASKDMLCGTRGAVFREIFIFHYPGFIKELQKLVPGATKDEELLCMLVALGQSADEIEQLFCLSAEQIYVFRKAVCWKMISCWRIGCGRYWKDNSYHSIKMPILAAKIRLNEPYLPCPYCRRAIFVFADSNGGHYP